MADAADAPTGWLVGAYAAAPSRNGWIPDDERAFLDALWARPDVVGLELPWKSTAFHSRDERWMLDHLPDDAQLVVTTAPDTSDKHRASASFGLASNDEDGRRAAVDATRALHAALPRLRSAIPAGRLLAVELHTAPRAEPGRSSAASLAASLDELLAWDWGASRIIVEHCDAWRPGQQPAKGYLRIEDEIRIVQALREQGAPAGVSLNWGRSVIEARDPDAAQAHAELAVNAGVLDGLILSGAATEATPLGGAWADVHAPFASEGAYASSLLTAERAGAVLHAAGELAFRAVKVGAPPGASVEERIAVVTHALDAAQARGSIGS